METPATILRDIQCSSRRQSLCGTSLAQKVVHQVLRTTAIQQWKIPAHKSFWSFEVFFFNLCISSKWKLLCCRSCSQHSFDARRLLSADASQCRVCWTVSQADHTHPAGRHECLSAASSLITQVCPKNSPQSPCHRKPMLSLSISQLIPLSNLESARK